MVVPFPFPFVTRDPAWLPQHPPPRSQGPVVMAGEHHLAPSFFTDPSVSHFHGEAPN